MTAQQGYERRFNEKFGSDITATDDPAMQEYELKVLRQGFARIHTSSEIMTLL